MAVSLYYTLITVSKIVTLQSSSCTVNYVQYFTLCTVHRYFMYCCRYCRQVNVTFHQTMRAALSLFSSTYNYHGNRSATIINVSSYMKRSIPRIVKRSIFINTETTPNPQSMKFLPGTYWLMMMMMMVMMRMMMMMSMMMMMMVMRMMMMMMPVMMMMMMMPVMMIMMILINQWRLTSLIDQKLSSSLSGLYDC